MRHLFLILNKITAQPSVIFFKESFIGAFADAKWSIEK